MSPRPAGGGEAPAGRCIMVTTIIVTTTIIIICMISSIINIINKRLQEDVEDQEDVGPDHEAFQGSYNIL